MFDWNWGEAERGFKQAIERQPGFALAYQLYAGSCLLPQRRFAEAIQAIEWALELNPFDAMLRASAIHIFAVGGDFEAATRNYAMAVEINPNAPLVYRAMGLAHVANGSLQSAISDFQKGCETSARHPLSLAALGYVRARSGDRSGADSCSMKYWRSARRSLYR